ncbi:MAG: hypothetical protein AAF790_09305 [Planctomycetota bacterium]
MTSRTTGAIGAAALAAALFAAPAAEATSPTTPYMWPVYRAQGYNWHGGYAHYQYGQPLALVVPPTANLQTNWGWGVGASRIQRIDHQFGRNYSGPGPHGGPFRPTPVWPQDTTQFGVYPVRAPW